MIPQLQKILEADDAQLDELIKIASQKAGPPNMQQFLSMMTPQSQPQEQQGSGGLAALLSQQMPQVPAAGVQAAPPVQGLAALLQGGGRT